MDDERLIPLSALQHYAYCPRQCALIHLEQAWAENLFTAQGKVLHQRVDSQKPETRKGVRTERAVEVRCERLGLVGKLDALEIDLASGELVPVEFKRGKPKIADWDRLQLCAQTLCLEEMRGVPIVRAALWYWQTRCREWVELDDALRRQTEDTAAAVREQFASGRTPKAEPGPRCQACSLRDLCQPELGGTDRSRHYVEGLFKP